MIFSGSRTSPRSFHTRTRWPLTRPRARASSGWISSGGVASSIEVPPNVDVMRWSEAGEISASG